MTHTHREGEKKRWGGVGLLRGDHGLFLGLLWIGDSAPTSMSLVAFRIFRLSREKKKKVFHINSCSGLSALVWNRHLLP